MNKETMQQILAWIESAGDVELEQRQYALKRLLKRTTADRRSDIRFALKLVEEEIIARSELMKFVK